MDDHDLKQNKLTSIDYLLSILVRLNICPEPKAMRIFQHYRSEIFYKHRQASKIGKLHLEK